MVEKLLFPFAITTLSLVACGGEGEDSGTTDSGTVEEVDRYDPEHLTVISMEMEEEDWDSLRHETRLFHELILGPECLQEPVPNIFEWYPGEVEVDGERLENVGFRKKGLIGSLSYTRPSLKIDSDRFVDGQHFADGKERFTLNNGNQDPSRLHTCLSYQVLASAGLPAPRCSLATVEMNGESLGVYANVEPIKSDFLLNNFGSDEGELYEGTASDFSEELMLTFEMKEDDFTMEPIEELAEALQLSNDELMGRLEELIDVEQFVTFWAAEGLIGHWDGYSQGTNNFYLYHDPADGLLRFIPWGVDATFEAPDASPLYVGGQLARRLYNHPDGLDMWYAESQRLLDEVWSEEAILAEIDRFEELITPHLLNADYSLEMMEEVRGFVEERRESVEAFLADSPDYYPWYIGERHCVDAIGELSATFDLEWLELIGEDSFEFSGTFDGEVNGEPLINEMVASVAGFDEHGTPLVSVIGIDEEFTNYHQLVLILHDSITPRTWDVDIAAITGYLIRAELGPFGQSEIVGLLGGEVTFDEVELEAGAPVSGSVEAIIFPNIFE